MSDPLDLLPDGVVVADADGRVTAINALFVGSSNQLGAVRAGFVAAATTPTFSVVSGGFACLGVVALVALLLPQMRSYRIDGKPVEDEDESDEVQRAVTPTA